MHHFDVMRFLRTAESRRRPSGHHLLHDHRSTDGYWDCPLRPQPGWVETLLTRQKIDFGRLAAIGSVLRETYAVLRLRVMRAGQLRGSNTRITRHRDGQASTRCYSGGILVLIVAATALCRDQGNDCARRRTDRLTLKGANARAYQPSQAASELKMANSAETTWNQSALLRLPPPHPIGEYHPPAWLHSGAKARSTVDYSPSEIVRRRSAAWSGLRVETV